MKERIHEKWKVRDIVFLAILSAVATCTAAVMAIVSQIYIFGLAQVATALQFSLFPAIALMKIRKPGCILFFCVFTGVVETFMSPVMGFSSFLTGIIIELLVWAIFRGYENDRAVFVASWLVIPMTLPFNLLYYRLFSREFMNLFFGSGLQAAAIGCVIAAVALSALGSFLGIKISRELIKAGVMKK